MLREDFVTIAGCDGDGLQIHLLMTYGPTGKVLSVYHYHRAMYPLESCKNCAQAIEEALK